MTIQDISHNFFPRNNPKKWNGFEWNTKIYSLTNEPNWIKNNYQLDTCLCSISNISKLFNLLWLESHEVWSGQGKKTLCLLQIHFRYNILWACYHSQPVNWVSPWKYAKTAFSTLRKNNIFILRANKIFLWLIIKASGKVSIFCAIRHYLINKLKNDTKTQTSKNSRNFNLKLHTQQKENLN